MANALDSFAASSVRDLTAPELKKLVDDLRTALETRSSEVNTTVKTSITPSDTNTFAGGFNSGFPNTYPPFAAPQPQTNFVAVASYPPHTHVVDTVSFQEDRLVGQCTLCNEFIHVKQLPGSINTMRAKSLLETYSMNKLAARYDEEIIRPGDVAAELRLLRKLLELDKSELDLAIERLHLVEGDIIASLNAEVDDTVS